MQRLQRILVATQWTGNNIAEVMDMVTSMTITGSTWTSVVNGGERLLITETTSAGQVRMYPVTLNYWVIVSPDLGIVAPMSPAVFNARYANAATSFAQSLVFAGAYTQQEVGAATVGALLLGASAQVVCPLSGAFVDTNYSVKVRVISGTSVLSALTVTNVVKGLSSVTVTLQAGVATLAGVVLVDCLR